MTGKLIGQLQREDGTPYLEQVFLAETWWSRFRGLQFQRNLPVETGLILKPCSSVHTFWMRFPVHIIFLNEQYQVVDCRAGLKPWRIVLPQHSGTASTLEVSVEKELPAIGEQLLLVTNAPT